jgi:predicted nucleotidyltransferase
MKLDRKHIIKFLRDNRDFLQKKYGVVNISLFGSYARQEQTEESDIDLLVEFDIPSLNKLAGLEIFLEESFKQNVSIVRKHKRLKPRFIEIISKDMINVS